MFNNYIKMTFRHLLKYKRFSIINIVGLAIGLCCFTLIMLWVQDELSFDRFHKNADRIYLAVRTDDSESNALTTKMLAPALKQNFPQVVNATSYIQLPESFKIHLKYKDTGFDQAISFTDQEFFNIFSYEYKSGDPQTALIDPNSIVLTESIAKIYFGDKDPIGETLELTMMGATRPLKVTGILKDIPHNSQIQRSIYAPIQFASQTLNIEAWEKWGNYQTLTYMLVQKDTDIATLENEIADYERLQLPNQNLESLRYLLFPITKQHLYAKDLTFFTSTGDIYYVYTFIAIAGLILLVASINYVNLTNALSLKRAKGIGIHKVVGAQRKNLILQHISETLILTTIALIVGLLMAQLLLPLINQLSGKDFSLQFRDSHFLLSLVLTLLGTSIISSIYPALFISGFQPIKVLKGRLINTKNGHNLQKSLLIFQFALSSIIIICTLIVSNQLHYFQNKNLGYDKENIICVRVTGDINSNYTALKTRLTDNPDIIAITRAEPLESSSLGQTGGVYWPGRQGSTSYWLLNTDEDFAKVYKIEMQDGRYFSENFATDKTEAYIINMPAAKSMGLENPVGTDLTVWGREGRIIGVTKDFNFSSLHDQIEPLIIRIPNPDEQNLYYRTISVRLQPNRLQESIQYIKETWQAVYPNQSFNYYFMDEHLNASYQAEMRMGELFKYFSTLAIFIASLGLWGLTAFSIEQKVKDIGIHKILGASIVNIIVNLGRNYFKWIIISNIIAWPLAYYAMSKWLAQYAFRIQIEWWVFLLAGFLTLVIAMLTISWQTVQAANADPVDALRYE